MVLGLQLLDGAYAVACTCYVSVHDSIAKSLLWLVSPADNRYKFQTFGLVERETMEKQCVCWYAESVGFIKKQKHLITHKQTVHTHCRQGRLNILN